MAFGDADLAYMLGEDFGYAVVIGGVTGVGIVDRNTEAILTGQTTSVDGQDISVLVKRGTFTVAAGTAATVNSVSYTVRAVVDQDESLTRLYLRTGT
jgi:hypothetical protein